MVLIITMLAAIFTFLGLFGGNADPASDTAMALTVYVLPLFIILDTVLLLFWLIRRRWHWAAIPGLTLLCCIPYIGTIFQTGLFSNSEDKVKSGINVATYNVAMFGREMNGFKAEDILAEMNIQQVDVLCLQEYMEKSGDKQNSERYLNYFTNMAKGRDDMVIFSRFPIIESGTIEFGQTNNSAMWADIDVNGKKMRFFNVHLETTGINRALRRAAKQHNAGQVVEKSKFLSYIYGRYTNGMAIRALQANLMASHVAKANIPVILCGDFNDVPYSYVYNKMKGDLVDGFKECGKGYMYTMASGVKKVRIDYIFHSEELKGVNYFKRNVTYSDHYPVFMRFAL